MGRFSESLYRFDEGRWAPKWLQRVGSRSKLTAGFESYPVGLELVADPEVAAEIRRKAWSRRMWVAPPIVVEPDDFLYHDQAQRVAGLRTPGGVNQLTARGILQLCMRSTDGAEGITRSSAERQREWARSASWRAKLRRTLGGIAHWI